MKMKFPRHLQGIQIIDLGFAYGNNIVINFDDENMNKDEKL